MPIMEVRINGRENALALLDTGGSGTFCTKALTERLGITGINEMYNLNTVSSRREVGTRFASLIFANLRPANMRLSLIFEYEADRVKVETNSDFWNENNYNKKMVSKFKKN